MGPSRAKTLLVSYIERFISDEKDVNGDIELSEPLIRSVGMVDDEYMWSIEPKLTRKSASHLNDSAEDLSFQALTVVASFAVGFLTILLVFVYMNAASQK